MAWISAFTEHRARLGAERQEKQRTPVTVTAVHRSNETSTPVTMTGALEPPLTPIGTIRPLRRVFKKEDQREAKEVTRLVWPLFPS